MESTTELTQNQSDVLEGYHQAADLIGTLLQSGVIEDIPSIYDSYYPSGVKLSFWFNEDQMLNVRKLLRAIPREGNVDKAPGYGESFIFKAKVRDAHVRIEINVSSVCEMVEDGEEEYEDEEILQPAITQKVTKTRPKYRKECPESLLALALPDDE